MDDRRPARLVRADTTLGNEEAGQVIVRDVLRDLDLAAVDVRMDEEALRAHPLASPFDWETDGKPNVVATWAPGASDERRAVADPERTHRRGEPRAVEPVG